MKILKSLVIGVVIVGFLAYLVLQLPVFGGKAEGARLTRLNSSPQYVDKKFQNLLPENTDMAIVKNLKLYTGGQVREPKGEIPVVDIDPESLKATPSPGLRAYWFGHASVLVELDGVRVMTDPVLSEYASPFSIGPKRFHRPPVALERLVGIDAVVISHDHYDHLDMKMVQHLGGQGTHFFVGLGIGAHLEKWGIPADRVHEMDWWEFADFKGISIHCTPARHYSGRRAMNNSTLWSSWTLKGPQHSVYFSGDTGYSPHFLAIRKRLGTVDLSLMKVGSYGETWLDIHMDPEAALQANADLGAKTMLPIHWATFNLSYHSWGEPIVRTLAAAAGRHAEVITPKIGEKYEAGKPFLNTAWYEPLMAK